MNYVYDNETEPEKFVCMSNDYGWDRHPFAVLNPKMLHGKIYVFHVLVITNSHILKNLLLNSRGSKGSKAVQGPGILG
jgi:hypothetical protein